LDALPSISSTQVEALNHRWIASVEELVAATATDEGKAGLLAVLQVSPGELHRLLDEAATLLGAASFAALSQAQPGGLLGLNVSHVQKEKRKPD